MEIRPVRPEDSDALRRIYGQYIDTPVTFEYQLPSPEEYAHQIVQTAKRFPYLVLSRREQLLGYACGHPERDRDAYQWNAELSIYLDAAAAGRGYGTKLYQALMDLLALQGIRTAYGVVTSPNPASEALHHALGFRLIGVHKNTGYKCGRWLDTLWFEKSLAPYDPEPRPVLPFCRLDPQRVAQVLAAYNS